MIKHRHLGVYGIVINNDQILLTKKSRGAYINKFDLPGGGIEHGEEILNCLKREMLEETGLKIKNAKLYNVYSYNIQWDNSGEIEDLHHVGIIYNVEVEDFRNLKLDGDGLDVLSVHWESINEIDVQNLSPFANRVIQELLCVKR